MPFAASLLAHGAVITVLLLLHAAPKAPLVPERESVALVFLPGSTVASPKEEATQPTVPEPPPGPAPQAFVPAEPPPIPAPQPPPTAEQPPPIPAPEPPPQAEQTPVPVPAPPPIATEPPPVAPP
ncbi:MAG: hypothetical protein JOZ58_13875, partial [Acetobacteraceae bacterium]|nr:hypothetical protein [Acetobacteraceae bacterium]